MQSWQMRSEEAKERSRRLSREAKRRRRGVCERCGGETRYNGKTINGPSRLCAKCFRTWTHCTRGHELVGENDIRDKSGGWACRTCRNEYMRQYQRVRYVTDPAVREAKRRENARQYAKRKAAQQESEGVAQS